MPDSIFSHHSVALVSFHHEGTAIEYSCCRGSRTVNDGATEFERELRVAGRTFDNDRPAKHFESAWVLDMRPAIDRHGEDCVFAGPLLNTMLPDEGESWAGDFGPVAVSALNQPRSSGLRWVSLTTYIAHWRGLGARVGRISDRSVVWEDVVLAAEPPQAVECQRAVYGT